MADPLLAIFVAGVPVGIGFTIQAFHARDFVFLVRYFVRRLRHR